jgi:ribosomal-protein-alanine N-acetyltransferase
MTSYETDRLLIRPTATEDAAFILELLNSPKWLQFIGDRKVRNLNDAENYINNRIISQYNKIGFSNFTVLRKSDSEKMGVCGIYEREGLEDFDLGFAFLPQFEQMGYAFEAAKKILELGLNEFKFKKICAITTKDNFSSQKLLKKLGFNFEKLVKIEGDSEELMLYLISV